MKMVEVIGHAPRNRFRRAASKLCGLESWKRRFPCSIWIPNYTWEKLFCDAIAGITVGMTSIPQGIAYAMIAGVPAQVGLYSSIFPGFMYALFGSCRDVTVGPTAILSALLAKYVVLSVDFAYLAAFLSGCIILLLGILQLGFLLDFISKPVISGFTTAAALQISASQLKSLFRVSAKSGSNFITALINFFKNIATAHLWDSVLGVVAIIALLLLKRSAVLPRSTPGCLQRVQRVYVYVVRARNALVVFGAAILAYILHKYELVPFALTGKIEGGLPHFGPPPFSTVVNNETLSLAGMVAAFGAEGLVMPLVAVLESIAIAKAFAGSAPVDGSQEMVALGVANMAAAFAQSMPATGSFTRSAINRACGVATPAGSFFKASLVLLSVTLLSQAFYYIPRAALAGVIIVAMFSLMEFGIVPKLWRNSKLELGVFLLTVIIGATLGLEYGILCGAGADLLRAMAQAAAPNLHETHCTVGSRSVTIVTFASPLGYASCERGPRLLRAAAEGRGLLVLDGRLLGRVDFGVAENLISLILDLEKQGRQFLLWNFSDSHRQLFEDISPGFTKRFVAGPSIDQHILALQEPQ